SFFGLFKKYPKITPGSIIYVPPRYDKNSLAGLSTILAKPVNSVVSTLNGLSNTLLSLYLIKGL
ncbi:MAG: hypothetical protein AAB212_08550, partial [Bacteroidota bacterium]